jgi:hypothetical protein
VKMIGWAQAITAALVTVSLWLAGVSTATAVTPVPAVAPFCGITWGSLAKSAAPMNQSPIVDARVGRHACWDRVVFDIAGSVGVGWSVSYVDTVTVDGSGQALDVPGGARLEVILNHPADDGTEPTFRHAVNAEVANVARFSTLRSVVWGGAFEGRSTLGVGVRARLPFRVFALDGPGGDSRIVLDVAHRWTAAETLDTYSHLWPDSDDTTGTAVDSITPDGDSVRTVEID